MEQTSDNFTANWVREYAVYTPHSETEYTPTLLPQTQTDCVPAIHQATYEQSQSNGFENRDPNFQNEQSNTNCNNKESNNERETFTQVLNTNIETPITFHGVNNIDRTASDDLKKELKDQFVCENCEEVFPTEADLNSHNRNEHLRCRDCDKSFENMDDLAEHIILSHFSKISKEIKKEKIPAVEIPVEEVPVKRKRGRPPGSGKNKKKISSKLTVSLKLAPKITRSKKKLDDSKTKVKNSKDLKGKIKSETEEQCVKSKNKFICNPCDISFKKEDELKDHTQNVHQRCSECEKVFSDPDELAAHVIRHIRGVVVHRCKLCEGVFSSKLSYNEHRLSCYNAPKDSKMEDELVKFMGKVTYLVQENDMIQGQGKKKREKIVKTTGKQPAARRFLCQECGFATTQKVHLQVHQRKHTGEKPYACDTCGKRFAHKPTFQQHIRIHQGVRPYKCQYCYKGFTTSFKCELHEKVHRGEKTYKCSHCDKAFYTGTRLKWHEETHQPNREKRFKCELCTSAFYNKQHLKRHYHSQHETPKQTRLLNNRMNPQATNPPQQVQHPPHSNAMSSLPLSQSPVASLNPIIPIAATPTQYIQMQNMQQSQPQPHDLTMGQHYARYSPHMQQYFTN